MNIRTARLEDAVQLVALYQPYVTDTTITFEYQVPSVAEFGQRITATWQTIPTWSPKLMTAPFSAMPTRTGTRNDRRTTGTSKSASMWAKIRVDSALVANFTKHLKLN